VFLTLALLGVLRAKALIEIHDRFRWASVLGRGNRITTAALYDFSNEIPAIFDYGWPAEPFDALGLYGDDDQSEPAVSMI
jgi:hypothetical protein